LAGHLQDVLADLVLLGRVRESLPQARGDTNALTVVAQFMMVPGRRETIAGANGEFARTANGVYAQASVMRVIDALATMYLAGCARGAIATP